VRKSENQGCCIGSDSHRRCRGSHTINWSDFTTSRTLCIPPHNALLHLLNLIHLMPPKRSLMTGLTTAERFLLVVASRLDTALRHMDANPGRDQSIYLSGLSSEMVRRMIPTVYYREGLTCAPQTSIDAIYSKFPQSQDARHRVHASIALVGQEWQHAAVEKRPSDTSPSMP
jgi:hypothetical protein